MKRYKLALSLGILLIIIGSLLAIAIIRSQNTSIVTPGAVTSTQKVAPKPNVIEGQPTELDIPSLGMDLPIIPGVYNPRTKTWTLTLNKVQYANITPQPNNQSGDTFLYGHYRSEVFARLHTILPQSLAVVKTNNGHSFYYQLASVKVTNPNDTSIFSYEGKPMLTIQTCTGLFFQNRQLFSFNLVRVA